MYRHILLVFIAQPTWVESIVLVRVAGFQVSTATTTVLSLERILQPRTSALNCV